MADPATITAVAKAAAAALSDERLRKTIGWVIAAVLSPLILVIVLVCSLLSGTTNHNNTAVELCFHGGVIPASMPAEYREYIGDMRQSFTLIDGAIASVNAEMEGGDSLDDDRVKAIFYSLFFGAESPSRLEHRKYVDCFVTYEERTRTVDNGDGTTSEETYTVAVSIDSLPTVYNNIRALLGRAITYEDQANANEIYYRARYGTGAPMEGDGSGLWEDWAPDQIDGFYSDLPVGEKGRRGCPAGAFPPWRPLFPGAARDRQLHRLQLSCAVGVQKAGRKSARHGCGAGKILRRQRADDSQIWSCSRRFGVLEPQAQRPLHEHYPRWNLCRGRQGGGRVLLQRGGCLPGFIRFRQAGAVHKALCRRTGNLQLRSYFPSWKELAFHGDLRIRRQDGPAHRGMGGTFRH